MSNTLINTLGTETLNTEASGIDDLSPQAILGLLHKGQMSAAESLHPSLDQIAIAAKHLAECVRAGGNLAYIGAGSPGLMAMADGLELQGTFGIPQSRVRILFAGGAACLTDMKGGPEDDADLARAAVAAAGLKETSSFVMFV